MSDPKAATGPPVLKKHLAPKVIKPKTPGGGTASSADLHDDGGTADALDDMGRVRAAEAAERVAQHRKEEVERRRREEQASRAKAEYIKKMLVEKERERMRLDEEIQRVKNEQLGEKGRRAAEEHAKTEQEKTGAFSQKAANRINSKEKPLYERLQEHYENTIVASERKRAEERIAFLHERAKPMGFDAMNEHDMKVTLRRQQAEQEAEKNRALRIKELRQTTAPHFRPKVLDVVIAEDQARQQAEKQRLIDLTEMQEKKLRYGVLVSEMYAPKVDPKKEMELKRRIEKMTPKRPPPIPDPFQGRPPPVTEVSKCPIPLRPYHDFGPVEPPPPQKKELKDYLTPARLQREEKEGSVPQEPADKKIAKYKSRASRAESWLTTHEGPVEAGGLADTRLLAQVSDAWVNVIGAKLAMLNELGGKE